MYDWKEVQTRLKARGFNPGPIDGVYGPRTEAAIIAFKRSLGFNPRPYFGPLTYKALMEDAPKSSLPWVTEAYRVMGLHEQRDRSKLMSWFAAGVSKVDPRSVSWCGAFVATALAASIPGNVPPTNLLLARAWAKYGHAVTPQYGAVMVFWRGSINGWQGHVAFYVGEDDTAYHVLGGNQSDAVTITRIAKTRLLASRFPPGYLPTNRIVKMTTSGIPLSTNEA